LTLGVGLFLLILRVEFDRLILIYCFLAGVFLQASLGIWQFLTQTTFSSKWLGLASHNAGDLGTSVVETLDGGRWLRAYGGLDHPNVLGGLLVIAIIFSIYQIQHSDDCKTGNNESGIMNYENTNFFKFIIHCSLFMILLAALFFTFSRGAWAGLIVGLVVMLGGMIFDHRYRSHPDPLPSAYSGQALGKERGEEPHPDPLLARRGGSLVGCLLKIICVGAVFVSILFFSYKDLVLTRLSQDTRLETKSNTERIASLRDATVIIKNNWLTGVGVGNYTMALANEEKLLPPPRPAGTPPRAAADAGQAGGEKRPSWFYQPAHNTFLLVWAEMGIVGLILFVAILIILIRSCYVLCIMCYENSNILNVNEGVIKLSLLLCLIILMLPDHYFWSLHFGILLFWFVIGLATRDMGVNTPHPDFKSGHPSQEGNENSLELPPS
jgi:O-antigen ligase